MAYATRMVALFVVSITLVVLSIGWWQGSLRYESTKFIEGRNLRHLQQPRSLKEEQPKEDSRNNVTYLYIVGVEGVGHHGVAPAISAIARSCNHHVDFASPFLRRMQAVKFDISYRLYLERWGKVKVGNNITNVLVLEAQSFPTDKLLRTSTAEQKKGHPKYDLEWIYNQTVRTGMDIKFLYLTRDFYRAVASHPEFDNGFEHHAQVLHDYTQHIHSEYETINRRQPGLWRQVHYEWFMELRNCTALVSAIIDFTGWDGCDVNFACQVLPQILRNGTARTENATERAIAQSLDLSLPIPALDIAENRTYAFSYRTSAMDASTYVHAWVSVKPPPAEPSGNVTRNNTPAHGKAVGRHVHTTYPANPSGTQWRPRAIGTRPRGWP